ncbi:uncharacterized protein B0J16DRAFT_84403 [Fusarium flagelliforme]|uniref:uncharacterized protein n=1 Tax=Fusarium flagelliforme TaxID=2675880 RepID=UPI001E8DD669|nr:uncharacterized protein B0J16DRAFT_84403 [Fusarium flagelliforme]KAH7193717.1 hypothetical protein B0J16DRAFT_84403 [Fusarium flagelliforme]
MALKSHDISASPLHTYTSLDNMWLLFRSRSNHFSPSDCTPLSFLGTGWVTAAIVLVTFLITSRLVVVTNLNLAMAPLPHGPRDNSFRALSSCPDGKLPNGLTRSKDPRVSMVKPSHLQRFQRKEFVDLTCDRVGKLKQGTRQLEVSVLLEAREV